MKTIYKFTISVSLLLAGTLFNASFAEDSTCEYVLNNPTIVSINNGTSTSTSTGYSSYYNYGSTQSLFTADQINKRGTILSYALQCNSTSTNTLYTLKVYMTETDLTSLSSSSAFSSSDMTLVYDHENVTIGGQIGWEKFTLDTPFEYSGKKNLVIAIYTYKQYSGISYYYNSQYSKQTIGRNSDTNSSFADPSNTSYYGSGCFPNIQLYFPGEHNIPNTTNNGFCTCSDCNTSVEPSSIDTIALADGLDYQRTTDGVANKSLTYTRDFATADQWEALYLPFTFNYGEAEAAEYELAELYTVGVVADTNEDGVIDSKDDKVMMIQPVSTNSTVLANTPYFIRKKEAGSLTITSDDNQLSAAAEGQVDCGTLREHFTLTGNNTARSGMKTAGYYTLSNGSLVKATDDSETLSSYRWYMECSSSKLPDTINLYERGGYTHTHKNPKPEPDTLFTSCTDERYVYYVCTCKETIYVDTLPAIGHVNPKSAPDTLAATCTEDGYIYYICKTCQDSIYLDTIPALGHIDIDDDDLCDRCDYEFPYKQVTAENYEKLGLEEKHIGYYAVKDKYQLKSMADTLNAMADIYYQDEESYSSKNFVLTNDIILNEAVFDANGEVLTGLEKWSSPELPPNSIFDGNNHTISGMYCINKKKYDNYYGGLFGQSDENSEICNVGVTNACIISKQTNSYAYVGSIVGTNMGDVKNCWSDAKIQVLNGDFGGIAGGCAAMMSDCKFNGEIVIDDSNYKYESAGGLVGEFRCYDNEMNGKEILSNCHFAGKIVADGYDFNSGSIIGYLYNCLDSIVISHCTSTGTIEYSCTYEAHAGLIGYVYSDGSYKATLSDCMMGTNLTISDGQYVGLITGESNTDIKAKNCLFNARVYSDIDSAYTDQLIDYNNATATYANVIKLADSISSDNGQDSIFDCTAEMMKAGYAAWMLGENWGQNLGTDNYPMPSRKNHMAVYKSQMEADTYQNDTVENFAVEEGSNYLAPINNKQEAMNFVAREATYSRTMSNEWGTICLPFSINYDEDNADYSLFHLTSTTQEGNTMVLNFEEFESGIIAGGTPMAVKAHTQNANGKYVLDLTEEASTFATSTTVDTCGSGWNMKGNFSKLENFLPEDVNMYYIAKNQFWYANVAVTMVPYRSWFEAPKSQNAASLRFVINEVGNETGIQTLESEKDKRVLYIFDLSGKRLSTPQEGVNLIKNKKVVIK